MSTLYLPYLDVSVNALWSDWQNYPNGRPNPLYAKRANDERIDGLMLSFITLSVQRTACWAAQPTMPISWVAPLTRELKANKRRVHVSFGGAANADISTQFSVEELEKTYLQVIDDLQADGLDFDLENGLYNVERICQALQRVQAKKPHVMISFTLPVMPDGLTSTGQAIVTTAKRYGLLFVLNGMAMDYYQAQYANQMGKAAEQAADSLAHYLDALYQGAPRPGVAVTPMIGMNDDRSTFTLRDAKNLGRYARHAGLSFIGAWSYNRDVPSSSASVGILFSGNPEQRQTGEYGLCFMEGIHPRRPFYKKRNS